MTFDLTKELLQGLPLYENGKISPNLYDAGGGFYDDRKLPKVGDSVFPRRFMGEEPRPIPREFFDMFVQRAAIRGEKVSVEETADGMKAVMERKLGEVTLNWKNDETMEMVYTKVFDRETFPDKKTFMRTVTETSAEAFESYIRELCGLDFEKVFENRIEDNIYYQLHHLKYHLYILT